MSYDPSCYPGCPCHPDDFDTEPTAVMCDCGRPMVLVNGNDECPVCDSIPSAVHKDPKLYQAGTHPVFSGGNWMARVAAEVEPCPFDGCVTHEVEETTARIEPETMAQMTVSR